ncbi:uncharacterized protein A4U43_C03F2010 [Asparagus officinalis]|uniref:Uncharacterized protein n=1 Tax=Asparagus officinalis TaxID=4686 RepID=A0A5P1F7C4_ASPOF|nr:inactive TPR repeat-containing thioredoxin TTL3-like [Asparagus officinalis]ONK74024.1 uncharacterized protein A4U43_C03F2010 [Asparagus officinalis]
MKQLPSPHVPVPGNGVSGELETMLYDYQKSKGSSKLVRATSGNVMLYGNLGNIRSKQSSGNDPKPGYRPNANRVTGSLVPSNQTDTDTGTVVLCRALSKRTDSEELKDLGNREFGEGRFAEALAYYDQAISMDPGKASYRSNKAAALMGLGRIFEAVCECKEAVRIDPGYCRAHNRLAGLYFRLGEAGKSIHHYRQSQREADPSDISKAQTLQRYIAKCSEARRTRDWQTMLKESQSAISFGADFALQAFSWKAEALMRLQKHDEADAVLNGAPKLDVNASTKIFGAPVNGYMLMIRAQVDMAAGRFDEAVSAAQRAMQLDRNNQEITAVLRRTKAVAFARSKGNEFFKVSNFNEACLAYGEGLGHDPQNAILLCNRAASQAKLAQWERAAEDCNAALKLRPSYAKARLRRAHCNAKMGRWAPAVQDYETLIKELPGDEEVSKALAEAKSMLQKKRWDLVKSTTLS